MTEEYPTASEYLDGAFREQIDFHTSDRIDMFRILYLSRAEWSIHSEYLNRMFINKDNEQAITKRYLEFALEDDYKAMKDLILEKYKTELREKNNK